MRLIVHKANELDRNIKCTVHTSGKLGFSEAAAKKLALSNDDYFAIATNDDDANDENLYLWKELKGTEGVFKVNKAGEYFSINTKLLFDKLKIDYSDKDNVVIFDIVDMEFEGKPIFKLVKRVQKRATKKKMDATPDSEHPLQG